MTEREIDRIANRVIEVLDKNDVLNKKRLTPFQKVEKILYNLDLLKGAMDTKRRLIEVLKNNPLIIKKGMSEPVQGGQKKYEPEIEKIENKISNCNKEIERIKMLLDTTETALKSVENDRYYRIIELKYFQGRSLEQVAEDMGISLATVKRNKNAIIRKLEMLIFSDDFIRVMFS